MHIIYFNYYYQRTPIGLEDVSKYPNLFAELLAIGWTEPDLIKLASGNIMRVLSEVEKVKYIKKYFFN